MATYQITINNEESKPSISAVFENVADDRLEDVLYIAQKNFRTVEIVDEETGEVAFTQFVGERIFNPTYSAITALDLLIRRAYGE